MPTKPKDHDPLAFHRDWVDHLWNPFYRFGRSYEAPVNRWRRKWRPRRRDGLLMVFVGSVVIILSFAITAEYHRTNQSLLILAATIPVGLMGIAVAVGGVCIAISPPKQDERQQ